MTQRQPSFSELVAAHMEERRGGSIERTVASYFAVGALLLLLGLLIATSVFVWGPMFAG